MKKIIRNTLALLCVVIVTPTLLTLALGMSEKTHPAVRYISMLAFYLTFPLALLSALIMTPCSWFEE